MLALIITALHSSHLTSTTFIMVTLTMAVCLRTWKDREEGEKGRGGGVGEKAHSLLGLREISGMQGREVRQR